MYLLLCTRKSEDNLCVSFLSFHPTPAPWIELRLSGFSTSNCTSWVISGLTPLLRTHSPMLSPIGDACFSKSQWKLPSVKLTILIFILAIVHHRIQGEVGHSSFSTPTRWPPSVHSFQTEGAYPKHFSYFWMNFPLNLSFFMCMCACAGTQSLQKMSDSLCWSYRQLWAT